MKTTNGPPANIQGDLILTVSLALALAGLIVAQSRSIRSELREAARERAALRDRMESQNSDLRDRLGRIEGYLDLLREFFVGSGRGTAA